ncbi:MAG: T9SS type A sorting domain-containing protein [Chitinophagales bacterium]
MIDTNALAISLEIINDKIKVYPNPTTSTVRVSWGDAFTSNEKIELFVYNIIGEQVASLSLAAQATEHQIDLSSFPSGLYLININQKNKIGTARVVKF